MKRRSAGGVTLEPSEHVLRDGVAFRATSETPWLKLDFHDLRPAGRWVELVYRASLFDPLTRPVLRFVRHAGVREEILPGALFGRSIWVGRVPHDMTATYVSPVERIGLFNFDIEECQTFSSLELLGRGLRDSHRHGLAALGSRLVGIRGEAESEVRHALGVTALASYHEWRGERLRALDLDGLDAPRTPWSSGPHVRIAVAAGPGDAQRIESLLKDLRAQPYPHWSIALVGRSGSHAPAIMRAKKRGRLIEVNSAAPIAALLRGVDGDVWLARIGAGDRFAPYALAVLAEAAAARPEAKLAYGDEDRVDASGRYTQPMLKPDWSPALQEQLRYLGSAVFLRRDLLRALSPGTTAGDVTEPVNGLPLPSRMSTDDILHIRRVLLTRPVEGGNPPLQTPQSHFAPPPAAAARRPAATIIIPTKNKPRLLKACIDGLLKRTEPRNFELIVIDNGSTNPRTLAYYRELAKDDRVRLLFRPGPFNFSKLCNEAATEARGKTIVFLNNDTEVLDGNWLAALLRWTVLADVGAVGAKLLYPSRRVQHVGVVIGMDGGCAHVGRDSAFDEPGYLGRYIVAHELSAVTGACLAVEAKKFQAIGGFDAENLPVDLNDIDLCLRLAERGWRNILEPDALLLHHESASRGQTIFHARLYRQEKLYFMKRWRHRLRDDPYFHPALSLATTSPALG